MLANREFISMEHCTAFPRLFSLSSSYLSVSVLCHHHLSFELISSKLHLRDTCSSRKNLARPRRGCVCKFQGVGSFSLCAHNGSRVYRFRKRAATWRNWNWNLNIHPSRDAFPSERNHFHFLLRSHSRRDTSLAATFILGLNSIRDFFYSLFRMEPLVFLENRERKLGWISESVNDETTRQLYGGVMIRRTIIMQQR